MTETEKTRVKQYIEDLLARIIRWDGEDARELESICAKIVALLEITGEDHDVDQFIKIDKALAQARTNAGCPLGPEPADGMVVDWSGRCLSWSQEEYRYASVDLNELSSEYLYHWGSVTRELLQRLDDDGRKAVAAAAAAPPRPFNNGKALGVVELVDPDHADIEALIALHDASKPTQEWVDDGAFAEPAPKISDEWLLGETRSETGKHRRYIVHLHHPFFTARGFDYATDSELTECSDETEIHCGHVFAIDKRKAFRDIEWFHGKPCDQLEWLQAAAMVVSALDAE